MFRNTGSGPGIASVVNRTAIPRAILAPCDARSRAGDLKYRHRRKRGEKNTDGNPECRLE